MQPSSLYSPRTFLSSQRQTLHPLEATPHYSSHSRFWQPLVSLLSLFVTAIQLLSRVQLFVTPWTAACQASLSFTVSRVCSDSCPLSQWCHPAVSSSVVPFSSHLLSFPASGSFPMKSALCIRWPKYWNFSISPSKEYSGLISFRIDWFDLPAVQGTLKSFLQYHSLKASILHHSAFFMVQLSHPYTATGKTIAWTCLFWIFHIHVII